ncbi:MAG: replication initiator protein A [Firmicutes bacterium]|nr:replication initiator protein A [Bacillota bacterium]
MMPLVFEYFYGNEAEQYSFYRIPKVLFKDKLFKDVSAEAKVLYGLMLDRMGLSVKNRWIDEENRVYIVYTIAEIMEDLNCADQKAGKLLSELDNIKGVGLIERKRQGLGKPNIIYVKNFCYNVKMQNSENHDSEEVNIKNQEFSGSRFLNSENHDSGKVNITNQEYPKSRTNNTNINNTDFNDTNINNSILSYHIEENNTDEPPDTIGWIRERKIYEKAIKSNIEYDITVQKFDKKWLDEIIELMVDVVCSREEYIRISKQEYPQEVVKSRFLKINSSHIEYIYFALKDNSSKVRNIRAFLITTIYRSFETADNWFSAKVNYDMAKTNEN